jgi:hypothetical protein
MGAKCCGPQPLAHSPPVFLGVEVAVTYCVNVVLPVTVFRSDRHNVPKSLFGCFDPKVVAMLAEIFMLRLEAERLRVQEVLPSSASSFVPLKATNNLVVKKAEHKAAETQSEEPLVQ